MFFIKKARESKSVIILIHKLIQIVSRNLELKIKYQTFAKLQVT